MKSLIQKTAMVFAVVMLSALGTQACSDEEVQGILLTLGANIDGPELAEVIGWFGCGDCDGVVEEAASMSRDLGNGDEDFEALVTMLSFLGYFNSSVADLEEAFDMAAEDYFDDAYPDGIPEGQEVVFGPRSGSISLDEVCGAGTGTLIVTFTYTYEGYPAEAGVKGEEEWGDIIRETERYILSLSNCAIAGNLLHDDVKGDGNYVVTLSGTVVSTDDWIEGTSIEQEVTGLITVNPGLAETAGTDPTPVWGFNTPLRLDSRWFIDTSHGIEEEEGGACYDGPSPQSEEACGDGIFADAGDVMPRWFY